MVRVIFELIQLTAMILCDKNGSCEQELPLNMYGSLTFFYFKSQQFYYTYFNNVGD